MKNTPRSGTYLKRVLELNPLDYVDEFGFDLEKIKADGNGDLIESIDFEYSPTSNRLRTKIRFVKKALVLDVAREKSSDSDKEKIRQIIEELGLNDDFSGEKNDFSGSEK